MVDFGVNTPDRVDYPDFVAPAARAVASGDCRFGVVFGGSGTGEQIVANKIRVSAAAGDGAVVTAALAREHNDANVLSMGARIVGGLIAIACVEAFLAAEFQGGRHIPRVQKISALESE